MLASTRNIVIIDNDNKNLELLSKLFRKRDFLRGDP
jgi:hypothetical protein